jgi:asparagine synthase (glutamine-hydrolysing)
MPGLFGIIAKNHPDFNILAFNKMLNCLNHEDFYHCGTYVDKKLGFWIGWVNAKGSFSECMPVWNENKEVCLFFSGEDFQDQDQITRLISRGHFFKKNGASYLVHMYEELKEKFFENLNGNFSGVLLDYRDDSVILFNDRFGLGRIYYHENKNAFFFSSEAKSLLKILPNVRYIDYRALAETISMGCVLENRTLFSGISIIPPGSKWKFLNRSMCQKETYFQLTDYENQDQLDSFAYYQNLKRTWQKILPRYFRNNEMIGMSLTGGVDCRMILAWANRQAGSMPCYTFSGMFRSNEDAKIASSIANIVNQKHYVLSLDKNFLNQFPVLAEKTIFVTDGTMDVTGAADLYVNRLARQISKIRLTGNYGQEILRDSVSFKPRKLSLELFKQPFAELINQANITYTDLLKGNRLSFIAFCQVPWYHYSRFALESSQITIRSPFLDKEIVLLSFRKPKINVNQKTLALKLISEGNRDLARIPTDRGLIYDSNAALNFVRKFQKEISFKLEYVYDYGMPHKLAKYDKMLSILHPEKLFLGRHKFYHFRIWYRDSLKNYIKEILLDRSAMLRPYIDQNVLRRYIFDHVEGRKNYTIELHCLLSIELLHRTLIEKV